MKNLKYILCVLAVLSLPGVCLAGPDLDALYAGTAHFTLYNGQVGASMFLAGTSMQWNGSEIWCYYVKFYDQPGGGTNPWRLGVGRARSTDGVSWTDDGFVLAPGGEPKWWFDAKTQLSHQIGRTDGDGWSANCAQDNQAYMCYGPYSTSVTSGQQEAIFIMQVDNNYANNDTICTVDVYDATTGTQLASKNCTRRQFAGNYVYTAFHLNFNFSGRAGHMIELRTYWYDKAYLKEQCAIVSEGNYLNSSYQHWDGSIASFPGVWKDGSTWYMVYEGATYNSSTWAGDIGLATSTDGYNFYRSDPNPILQNNTSGWESINIGTPTIRKWADGWRLWYHGYDNTDCRVGQATGTSLTSLTKYSGNPTINTVSGTWEAGTVGDRSTVITTASGYNYMAYEGSTDKVGSDFGLSIWGTGIARSTDLITWSKYSGNPVTPTGQGTSCYSLPELIVIGTDTYLYVSRPDNNGMQMYKLVNN
ncbi:MAG: hypothetical protein A2Y12_20725 [Planctomycetes bacterium GWF2_42_9]|nr:MAG: hypothetical protein A2Y12_20725 [Planctomycetes bacterium GWF2_42_9]